MIFFFKGANLVARQAGARARTRAYVTESTPSHPRASSKGR